MPRGATHNTDSGIKDKPSHRRLPDPSDKEHKKSRTEKHGRPPRPSYDHRLKELGVSPFSSEIEAELPPAGFHLPKFTKFDPKDWGAYTHLIQFSHTIVLWTRSDAIIIMCKALPSSLGSLGLQWFNKLPAGSIRTFAELKRAFNTRFITSNYQAKEPDALSQMRKCPNKTLREYADRYWQLFNEIPGVDKY